MSRLLFMGFSAFSTMIYDIVICIRYEHTKKVLLSLYFRRGSRMARITNTTKVVHNMCTNKCQLCDS